MSPQAQLLAIANAHGWTNLRESNTWYYGLRPGNNGMGDVPGEAIPDYLNNLNAIHGAEKILKNLPEYCAALCAVVYAPLTDSHEEILLWQGWWFVTATAAQRAEAFLRTLNLWDDTK